MNTGRKRKWTFNHRVAFGIHGCRRDTIMFYQKIKIVIRLLGIPQHCIHRGRSRSGVSRHRHCRVFLFPVKGNIQPMIQRCTQKLFAFRSIRRQNSQRIERKQMGIVTMRFIKRHILTNPQSLFIDLKFNQIVNDVLPLRRQWIVQLKLLIDIQQSSETPLHQTNAKVHILTMAAGIFR